jgi:hypothetical protein
MHAKREIAPATAEHPANRSGKLGWIFLWLVGVPIPILIILFLMRGCT